MTRIPFIDSPDWQRMTADDLYRYFDRARLEFGGDRVLLLLTRPNRRHVQKLLKKLRKSGRKLPCKILIKSREAIA